MAEEAKQYDFYVLKGDVDAHIMSVRMNADGTKELIIPGLVDFEPDDEFMEGLE